MAWAIFTRTFDWPRPQSPHSFHVEASQRPQQRPHDVIDAAVAAGAARKVPSPTRDEKRALDAR